MRAKVFIVMVVVIFGGLLEGCGTTPLTPSQTAQHFWSGVLDQDADKATYYTTKDSVPLVEKHLDEFRDAAVSFGQVSIQKDTATVETTLRVKISEQQVAAAQSDVFFTYLQREQEQWRVDYRRTEDALIKARQKEGLSKIVEDLNQLGQSFSEGINKSLKNWEETKPQLKKDLQDLGESVQREVDGAVEKYGPEIQRNLQDFTQSLEDALEQIEKSVPKEQPGQPQKKQNNAEQPEGRMI